MLFKKKTESYTIKEFLNRGKEQEVIVPLTEWEIKKAKEAGMMVGFSLPLLLTGALKGTKVFADTKYVSTDVIREGAITVAGKADMYHKMVSAFDPLIGLVQALAYPICMVVVLGGALFIMIGNREKGFAMMQGAGLGYVLVQLTPMILNILVDAMKSAV